jgi:putative transposase
MPHNFMTIMPDHIHIVAIIPPKLAVAELMGILKGKTAIAVFQQAKRLRTKPYWGNFWSRGALLRGGSFP